MRGENSLVHSVSCHYYKPSTVCSYHRATGEELTWPGLLFLSNTLGLSYRILFISCVCGFGSLHSLVCQICNGDEETCLLALRRPGGVNKHHGETKEGKHSCSIWLKDGLAWVGLKTEHPRPTSLLLLCWKREIWGGRVSGRTLLTEHPSAYALVFISFVWSALLYVSGGGSFPVQTLPAAR